MMSYVLDGRCDTRSSLPSDECICGVSHSPALVGFPATIVFNMGGPRHNILRYPACVNVPCCVRLDTIFTLILNVYLAQLPKLCTIATLMIICLSLFF